MIRTKEQNYVLGEDLQNRIKQDTEVFHTA